MTRTPVSIAALLALISCGRTPSAERAQAGDNLTIGDSRPTGDTAPFLSNGLIGYWALDDGSGPYATDSSGHGQYGALLNDPTWSPGKVGGALDFDGIDDHVLIVYGPGIAGGDFAIALWGYLRSKLPGEFRGFAGMNTHSPAVNYVTDSTNWGSYWDPTGTISTGRALNLDQWYHLIIQRRSGSLEFFENGDLVFVEPDVTQSMDDGIFNIGRRGLLVGENDTDGLVDDVRFYNRALTTDEALQLFEMGN